MAVPDADLIAAALAGGHVLETAALREALARLTDGLGAREPFLLVTGESGTGKTALVREAVARWGARAAVAFVANPTLTRTELLEEITRRFGVEPPANAGKPQLMACLERVFADTSERGQVAVIVIDDAHDLEPMLLEELRLLANAAAQSGRRLEILLAGLPSLATPFAEPASAPLRQRIGTHCRVSALTQKETRRHLHEMVGAAGADGPGVFPRETCREIFGHTRGVARAVNALAAEAMRQAQAAGAGVVTCDHVRAAATALGVAADPDSTAGTADAKPGDTRGPGTGPDDTRTVEECRDVAREAAAAAARAPAPGDASLPVPDPHGKDPRVRDWVARFIAENEPRFGSRFEMGVLDSIETVTVSRRSKSGTPHAADSIADTAQEASAAGRAAEPAGPAAEASTRADEATSRPAKARGAAPAPAGAAGPPAALASPPHRGAPRREARDRRGPERTPASASPGPRRDAPSTALALAITLVGLAALAAVIVLPRAGRLPPFGGTRIASTAPTADQGSEEPMPAAESAPAARLSPAPGPGRTDVREAKRGAARAPETTSHRAAEVEAAPSDGDAPAPADQPLALDVGTYINPDRAAYERTRLAEETGLQAWIIRGSQDGAPTYRVVLGIYSTLERAHTSASILLERGLVTEAVVIPLPPRSTRQ